MRLKRTGPAFNQMKGRSLVSNVVTGNGGRSEMRLTRGGHSIPLNRPACLVVSGNAADLSLHEDYERRAKPFKAKIIYIASGRNCTIDPLCDERITLKFIGEASRQLNKINHCFIMKN